MAKPIEEQVVVVTGASSGSSPIRAVRARRGSAPVRRFWRPKAYPRWWRRRRSDRALSRLAHLVHGVVPGVSFRVPGTRP